MQLVRRERVSSIGVANNTIILDVGFNVLSSARSQVKYCGRLRRPLPQMLVDIGQAFVNVVLPFHGAIAPLPTSHTCCTPLRAHLPRLTGK